MKLWAILAGDQARIMTGGHEICSELLPIGPQLAELEPGVANDARVGRAAGEVLVGEVVDDPAEMLLEVEGVERDVEPIRDAAPVARIDGRAAAFFAVRTRISRAMHAGAHE